MTFRIGIISDTHGLLRPEAERRLAGVDHIVHAGDIGNPDIIFALRRIAPVTAIRGNVDTGDGVRDYAETELVRLADWSIFVLHDLKALRIDPVARGIDVVVSGHSHVPNIDTVGGVLYLNPGSAGRRRFSLRSRWLLSISRRTACDRSFTTLVTAEPRRDMSTSQDCNSCARARKLHSPCQRGNHAWFLRHLTAMANNTQSPDRGTVIYKALWHAIIEQALLPGAKLPEDAIGEKFGASRTIVRAALGRLATEGLVELRRNRGAAVATPSWSDARDIFDVRVGLERLVVARLAGALTREQIKQLKLHVDAEEKARGSNEPLSIRLATAFHIKLAEMTGNPVLARYVSEVASRCGLILSLYSRPHSSECAVSEHRAIIAALASGDSARAAALMDQHLAAVADRALIASHPPKQRDIKEILSPYAQEAAPVKAARPKRR